MPELTVQNCGDEIARVHVRIDRSEPTCPADLGYRSLRAYPTDPVPLAMQQADAGLSRHCYFTCDNTAPEHWVSTFETCPVEAARGYCDLVLQRRGFVFEPSADWQI